MAAPTDVTRDLHDTDGGGADGTGSPPRRRRTALVAAVVVGLVLAALVVVLALGESGPRQQTGRSALVGEPAPALAGTSLLDGASFDIGAADGQFTLVNFFATWCVPCIEEHPELVRFAETHAATGDARVVSVVLQDDPADVQAFFEEEGGDWPVLADPGARSMLAWKVTQPPESFLVGPDGIVRAKIIGGVTAEYLDALLVQVQGGAPVGEGTG